MVADEGQVMVFEDGFDWRPIEPEKRGRFKTVSSAFDAAFNDLTAERNQFFNALADNWKMLFPALPARPGRYEDGKVFIYVRNSSVAFVVRPQLRKITAALAKLPGAPKKLEVKLEVHVL